MKRFNQYCIFMALLCLPGFSGCSDDSTVNGNTGEGCGNASIETGEACDDGNTVDGDGCSADCKTVEDGYKCPEDGGKCTKSDDTDTTDTTDTGTEPVCGNGKIEKDEVCDDSNTSGEDGCAADCKSIDNDYECPTEGEPCKRKSCGNGEKDPGEDCDKGIYNINYGKDQCTKLCKFAHYCGDGKLEEEDIKYGKEECDKGEQNEPEVTSDKYDVCSANCKHLNYCGDGKRTHDELCDDGNVEDNDGCSSKCEMEPGFVCTMENGKSICRSIDCGNGKVDLDKQEQCDDGNRVTGDGCSPVCRIEKGWVCTTDSSGKSVCTTSCGNSVLDKDAGETCEDGNQRDGDGCSSTCQTEPGWYCQMPENAGASGQQMTKCFARACGDGFVVGTEECDDGNITEGDGCNKFCKREKGYNCPTPGEACVLDECGDGRVTGDENCDEGSNHTEGCINCQIQAGWECLVAGSACTNTAVCGDGKLQGIEECDDSNTNDEDGCSSDCIVENGYTCEGFPSLCIKGPCGDGIVQKGEDCDDQNDVAGDGCSPVCTKETMFDCGDNGCKPICGDGLTIWEAGEQCDDGNLVNGDGCSSDCKIEKGYTCTKFESEVPDELKLPIVYRDFRRWSDSGTGDGYLSQALYSQLPQSCKESSGYRSNGSATVGKGSPDFQHDCVTNYCVNSVLPELDSMGKPVLGPPSEMHCPEGSRCDRACYALYTCQEVFNWWYTDVNGMNRRVDDVLTLTREAGSDPASYVFDSGTKDFLPIGNRGFNDGGSFTSEFETYFKFRGNETLNFNGDDDVWVFFNGRLGVDVGGIHGAWNRSITFDEERAATEFKMFPGGIYSLKMFHAERCM